MLRAMLIDDELFALKELQLYLEAISDIHIVGSFSNPLEGFFNIAALNPEVIFLDIDMPEVSGIYLAEQIMASHPDMKIIFVTAYDQFAINAFELNAVDYILKPVTSERIAKTLSRLEGKTGKSIGVGIRSLSSQYEESIRKLFVYEEENIVLLSFKDIYYIEALNKCVRIRTKDKFYSARQPLNYFESKLRNLNFFQPHRSYLINLDKVSGILPRVNYSYDIMLTDINDLIPVSRANVKLLRELLEL